MQDAPRYLIIDDIAAALALLTPLGRSIISDPAHEVRTAVRKHVERLRWTLISYETFAEWTVATCTKSAIHWIVLDPLLPLERLPRSTPLRLSRGSGAQRFHFQIHDSLAAFRGVEAGIVDDAASSGATLSRVGAAAAGYGAKIREIVLCATSRAAYDRALREQSTTRWKLFMDVGWVVIHLRDACPFLPFTGRRTQQPPLVLADGAFLPKLISAVRGRRSQ